MGAPKPFSFVIVICVGWLATTASADEWKARHPVTSTTGILNFGEGPSIEDAFAYGPSSTAETNRWREDLRAWRASRLTRLRNDGPIYDRPDLSWVNHVFSQVQLLIWERDFYDTDKRQFTVDRFLRDTDARIGPIDAVLVWHVYPNVGVDDRNQFDLLRDLPGGIPGIRKMVQEFHDRGVKVFFPAIAWDTGTRDEGSPMWETLARLSEEIGFDGVNFDTLESVPIQFRIASDASRHPFVLETQSDPRDWTIAWTNLAWNDWVSWDDKVYPFIPMVSRSKWLYPNHAVNVADRYARDKTDTLQHAFFNGQGYASLENLWGHWYPASPRDAEAIKRFTRIERVFAENLRSPDWEPHTPMIQEGVFASKFPGQDTVWTIVNRNEYNVQGEQVSIAHTPGVHYYDLWHGTELTPSLHGNLATLTFAVEGHGFGTVLATTQLTDSEKELLTYMGTQANRPLNSYSRQWKAVPQTLVEIAQSRPVSQPPAGMIRVPEAEYDFQVKGIEVEGANDPGVDVQYPWEDEPRRSHRHRIHIHAFFIDRDLVTNAEFKKFLDATHYHPADDHNFLREWKGGTYPKDSGNRPVTWVSIEDARAYAGWAGKRLPHEWEWQYAAQSTDGRSYPWGNEWNEQAIPPADHGRTMRPVAESGTFPLGASAFGVLDLEGNVSQWTDEYQDEHTRAAIIRGGAAYQPRGSIWYFPQSYRLDEHQKYLLMSPGRDRAGTIGFRCVLDAR
jgi:gamma-glutamyl hercynylcysteine S-oxide synthase